MILLSRDDLPQDWFEQLSEEWLRWTPDMDFLRNHMLTQNLGESFVRQAEQILNSYQSRSGLRAKLSRPFTVIPHQEILAQMDDGDGEDDPPPAPSATTRALRGSGSRWSRRLFETLHEDWMREQCTRQSVPQR
jgi:hypothetical protein